MRGRVPDDVIEHIRNQFDIVDIVSEQVTLKRMGRSYVGLCPFHSEKTPSFSVSREKQIFHCFGCKAGGDVFRFVMMSEGLSFIEALDRLAKRAGIALPLLEDDDDTAAQSERREMFRACELAAKWYHHVLMNTEIGAKAYAYLKGRGLDASVMNTFQLGYAPDSWDGLLSFLKRRGFDASFLERIGLVSVNEQRSRYFDRFRGRVTFPIHDGQGRVIAFGGRVLGEGEPKYLNTAETEWFHKGRHLYNLHRARGSIRQHSFAILLEGYMDVISLASHGFENVVAGLGTALTPDQARLIARNVKDVVLMYDGDKAGQSAALRNADILKEADCRVRIVSIPEGLDPDEYLKTYGKERFGQLLDESAVSSLDYKLSVLRQTSQLSNREGILRFLGEAVKIIADAESPVEQETYLRDLAGEFNVTVESLKQEMRLHSKKQLSRDNTGNKWNTNRVDGKRTGLGRVVRYPPHIEAERMLLTYMLLDVGVGRQVQEDIVDEFSLDEHIALAAHLYRFYGNGDKADPAAFINQLNDDSLRALATSLIAEHDLRSDRIADVDECIRRMRVFQKEQEIKRVIDQMGQVQRTGQLDQLEALRSRFMELRQELDDIKTQGRSGS